MRYVPIKTFFNLNKKPIMIQVDSEKGDEEMNTRNVAVAVLQTTQYKQSSEILKAADILGKEWKEVDGYLELEDADFEFIKEKLFVNELFLSMKLNAVEVYKTFKAAVKKLPAPVVDTAKPGEEEELDN